MSARWVSLLVWAAVAASALYWGQALWAGPPQAAPQARPADPAQALGADLTRLLGSDPAPPPADAPAPVAEADPRFTLVGVASPQAEAARQREGVALIAIDGNPPKVYRVGAVVDGDNILQAVGQRSVLIGPRGAPASAALELPPPSPAATGVLPAHVNTPAAQRSTPPARPTYTPQPGLRQSVAPPGAPRTEPEEPAPDEQDSHGG